MAKAPLRSRTIAAASGWLFALMAVGATTGSAATMTYSVADFPLAEADLVESGYQDAVSGTITASATNLFSTFTAGSFAPSSDPASVSISWDITLQSFAPGSSTPSVSATDSGSGTLNEFLGSGDLTFTSTSMILGGYLDLQESVVNGGLSEMYWRPDINSYFGIVIDKIDNVNTTVLSFQDNNADALLGTTWTVGTAAVPEPSSLILVTSAAFGLIAAATRRRRGVLRGEKTSDSL